MNNKKEKNKELGREQLLACKAKEEFLKQLTNTFGHIASLLEEGRSTNKKANMELEYIEKLIIEREINANSRFVSEVTK